MTAVCTDHVVYRFPPCLHSDEVQCDYKNWNTELSLVREDQRRCGVDGILNLCLSLWLWSLEWPGRWVLPTESSLSGMFSFSFFSKRKTQKKISCQHFKNGIFYTHTETHACSCLPFFVVRHAGIPTSTTSQPELWIPPYPKVPRSYLCWQLWFGRSFSKFIENHEERVAVGERRKKFLPQNFTYLFEGQRWETGPICWLAPKCLQQLELEGGQSWKPGTQSRSRAWAASYLSYTV